MSLTTLKTARMKMNSFGPMVLATAILAGCDSAWRQDCRDERADEVYQAALADYTAGRLDAAQAGFERVVRADPGNASARFQLAVLLQDARRDYLGAIGAYREFMLLAPESDKIALARERSAQCASLYVRDEAARLKLGDCAAMTSELEKLRTSEAAAREELQRLRSELDRCLSDKQRIEKESAARAALIARIGGTADRGDVPLRPADNSAAIAQANAVVAEDGGAAVRKAATAAGEAEDGTGAGRLQVNPEALAIFAEEERSASTLLPPQTPQNRADEKLSDSARKLGHRHDEARDPERPATYTVEAGDTLVKIALRFYGRKSAWKLIREANKATVPVSGAVRAGQTLILP